MMHFVNLPYRHSCYMQIYNNSLTGAHEELPWYWVLAVCAQKEQFVVFCLIVLS